MTNLTLGLDEPEAALRERAAEALGVEADQVRELRIARKSLDARRSAGGRRRFRFVVHVDVTLDQTPASDTFERGLRGGRVREVEAPAQFGVPAAERVSQPAHVAVVGAGPAGLFAARVLAENGVAVTLIDRGDSLRPRGRALAHFLNHREVDPESNLLFGEGGAGTYSDGKLYTRVDHPLSLPILEALVAGGAPPEIVYDARAHIGTDRLHRILPALREGLEMSGVTFRWRTRLEGLRLRDQGGRRVVEGIETSQGPIDCDAIVLGVGHSARDTWALLHEQGVEIEVRASQLGVRIEHPQKLIDRGRFGEGPEAERLGAAYYSLVCRKSGDKPGGYSFCMCPGGQIVASVNTPGLLCTNGMSNSRHSSPYANAAVVTPVEPSAFGPGVFAGVDFQRELEARFFAAGGSDYRAPAQRASDFMAGRASSSLLPTSYKFGTAPGRIDELLPEGVRDAVRRSLAAFDRNIPGFAGSEGMLVGVETRCSAPLRLPRDPESFGARGIPNLLPVGEGAGYAGGILSAAIDGARAAQALLRVPR
ncbi:MAG: FAD-dependent monooxygenase [Myxococcota bacterium]|nr:FAD-dependent monooxygenase [Myxococcota bacterium]